MLFVKLLLILTKDKRTLHENISPFMKTNWALLI